MVEAKHGEDRPSWTCDLCGRTTVAPLYVRPNDDKLREWPPSDARGCEGLACPAAAPVPRAGGSAILVFLLLLERSDVVHCLPLGVHALRCDGHRLPVLRDDPREDLNNAQYALGRFVRHWVNR
jgi:hypothetical protein